MKMVYWLISFVLCFLTLNLQNSWGQNETSPDLSIKIRSDCWRSASQITLLDTLRQAMLKEIEDTYKNHNFIQTYGCAYEETDIEKNSIKAVYRAIIQSIINRKVTLRDDLMDLLIAKPPRPDNLTRDYVIYVNLTVDAENKAARYEIKILDLEAIPTIESPMSVWTRVVTRFAYKEDYNKAIPPEPVQSEFIQVMETAQTLLKAAENKNFNEIRNQLRLQNIAVAQPGHIRELLFGDSMKLFDSSDPGKSYVGVFLGKGIYVCETPKDGVVVCKFGEERLYSVLIDANSFRRTTTTFSSLDYEAPESILQCLLLKFASQKPEELPPIESK